MSKHSAFIGQVVEIRSVEFHDTTAAILVKFTKLAESHIVYKYVYDIGTLSKITCRIKWIEAQIGLHRVRDAVAVCIGMIKTLKWRFRRTAGH